MTERGPKPGGEGVGPIDPVQREMDLVDQRLASSRKLPRTALERSLDKIGRVGGTRWSSPGEMFANLAGLSGKIAEAAAARGQTEDAAAFIERQQEYLQTSEAMSSQPETILTPSRRSRPRRTTGVAAG